MSGKSIERVINEATTDFVEVSDTPRLDAEVLLAHVLGKGRSYFRAFPEQQLESEQLEQFEQLRQQRAAGHPVAHLTGQREFWSLGLSVNQHTLIPRPDTEVLVEFILENCPASKLRVADLGTGSGAIAIALARENPEWCIIATDQSSDALATAHNNADRLNISNISFHQGNWLEALEAGLYDLIVSNPPYIRDNDPHLAQGDVRFEPLSALTSGNDGLNDIRHLISHAKEHLEPGGWLVLEHGYDQQKQVISLFEQQGFSAITTRNDYAGQPRMTAAQNLK